MLRRPAFEPTHTQGAIMGILGNIFSKIFPSAHAANNTPAAAPAAPAGSTATPAATASPAPTAAAQSQAMAEIDVEQMLDGKAASSGQKLNWKTSIVDLMKLLDLDSSLASRKELAQELHYTGDTNDSATMNVWLHRQVMNKVAANGGKVPADLKD
jgi:propanediol dehydratase small subunit